MTIIAINTTPRDKQDLVAFFKNAQVYLSEAVFVVVETADEDTTAPFSAQCLQDACTRFKIQEAAANLALQVDNIYILPSTAPLTIGKNSFVSHPSSAIDKNIFWYNLAYYHTNKAIGIALQNAFTDSQAMQSIHKAGGITIMGSDTPNDILHYNQDFSHILLSDKIPELLKVYLDYMQENTTQSAKDSDFTDLIDSLILNDLPPITLLVNERCNVVHFHGQVHTYFDNYNEDFLLDNVSDPLIHNLKNIVIDTFTNAPMISTKNYKVSVKNKPVVVQVLARKVLDKGLVMLKLQACENNENAIISNSNITENVGPLMVDEQPLPQAAGKLTLLENDTSLQIVPTIDDLQNDLDNLIQSTETGILFLDENLNIRRYTDSITKHIAISAQDINQPIANIATTINPNTLYQDIQMVQETGQTISHNVCSNDSEWYFMRVSPYHTLNNTINGIVVTFSRAYEYEAVNNRLNQLSQALQQQGLELLKTLVRLKGSEEKSIQIVMELTRQKKLFEHTLISMQEGVAAIDSNGVPTLLNRKARQLAGLKFQISIQDWVKKQQILYPDNNEPIALEDNPFMLAIQGHKITHQEILLINDSHPRGIYLNINADRQKNSDNNDPNFVIVINDITERKRAEIQLRNTEATQRALLNAMPDTLIHINREGFYLDYMPPKNGVIPSEVFLGKQINDFLPKYAIEMVNETLQRSLETNEITNCTFEYTDEDQIHFYEIRFSPINNKSEVLCVLRDISQATAAKDALEKSAHYYHKLISNSPAPIVVVDSKGNLLEANGATLTLIGAKHIEEIKGKSIFDFVSKSQKSKCKQALKQGFRDEIPNTPDQYKLCKLNGKQIKVEVMGNTMTINNKIVAQIIIREIK